MLSDPSNGVTLFLPTNDAINATLNKFGLDLQGLLQNQGLVEEVISYHILPSPIEVSTKPYNGDLTLYSIMYVISYILLCTV